MLPVMKTVIAIIWGLLLVWVGLTLYIFGADFWIPSLWPFIFAIYWTRRAIAISRGL